jgi:hypothetical protein
LNPLLFYSAFADTPILADTAKLSSIFQLQSTTILGDKFLKTATPNFQN